MTGLSADTHVGVPSSAPPRLAEGTELLGAFQGSGLRDARCLVRRPDGGMLQVSPLTYAVAAHADGRRAASEIAALVGADIGRDVTAGDVTFLLEEKLGPAGLLHATGTDAATRRPALLDLGLRTAVIPQRLVGGAASALRPLFWPPVVAAVLGAFAVVSAWLHLGHGVGRAVEQTIATPAWLLAVGGLTALSGACHELGHATATRYGGARPGVIGAGLYLIWPAFFNDLTDSYRLGRGARLRADLGGVYFNAVFVVVLMCAYAGTGFEPLLVAIAVQHLLMLHQLLPFPRLDGYYIASDLAGVPDLFARIKPVLARLVPGRHAPAALSDLRRGARWVVAAWVVATVPALLGALVVLLARLPVAVALAQDSFTAHRVALATAMAEGEAATVAASALQLAVLLLPLVGVTVTASRLLARGRHAARRRGQVARPVADQVAGPGGGSGGGPTADQAIVTSAQR